MGHEHVGIGWPRLGHRLGTAVRKLSGQQGAGSGRSAPPVSGYFQPSNS